MIPARSKDITAHWLNEALHSSGFLGDVNIVSLSHEPWGVGEGFVSDMARLALKYDRQAPHLPKTLIAKLPIAFEVTHALAMQYNLYEKEIRFYVEVAQKSPIRTPGLIYQDMDPGQERFCLILEDCSHYAQIGQDVGLNDEQTKQVALRLADFHAHWWDSEELDSFAWLPKSGGPETTALIDNYRLCWQTAIQSEEFLASLPEGGREAGQKLSELAPALIEETPSNHLTITHFDFRVENMFFDFENVEDPVVVFDWQLVGVSRGVIDLAYLLGGSLAVDLRRQIEKDTVKLYHQRLVDRGVSGYSYDECWADYLAGILFCANIPVVGFSALDLSDNCGKRLVRLLTERHFASIVDNDATSVLP